MSLVVDKVAFAEQLAAVSAVVKAKSTIPVLSYVKLEALMSEKEDAVFLSATDLDNHYRRSVAAEVGSEFSCLLPARMIREWLASVGPGSLVVTADARAVSLKVGTNVIEIGTLEVPEFPKWPEFTMPPVATADLKPVSAVMVAAPDTDARIELFDIQISRSGQNQLRACSARGVMFAELLFPGQIEDGHTLHVTPPTIEHVSRLGPCQITDGPNFVSFTGEGFTFLSKKLASKTLDFKKEFDRWTFAAHSILIREEFTEAVASCHVLRGREDLGKEENAYVIIEAEKGGLAVHCKNERGQFSAFLAARVEGAFNRVKLPTGQLLPALRASAEETVRLSVSNPVTISRMELGPTTIFISACRDK